VISTPGDEAGGVFSPDGREFYFAQMSPTTTFPRIGLLCVSHWNGKNWSRPEALPFSGKGVTGVRISSSASMTPVGTGARPSIWAHESIRVLGSIAQGFQVTGNGFISSSERGFLDKDQPQVFSYQLFNEGLLTVSNGLGNLYRCRSLPCLQPLENDL
jgi:hypothetical protein